MPPVPPTPAAIRHRCRQHRRQTSHRHHRHQRQTHHRHQQHQPHRGKISCQCRQYRQQTSHRRSQRCQRQNPPPVPATPATHPEPRISLQTPEKIRNSPKAHPRARGNVTHEKNPKQKLLRHCPSNKEINSVEHGEKYCHEPTE